MASLPPPAPPVVTYVQPAHNNTNVAVDSDIIVKFQDSVKTGSGVITISNGQGDTRRIAIHDSSQVSVYSDADDSKYGPYPRSLKINPQQNLLSNSTYFVQIEAGAITSFSDIPMGGVSDTSTYNFTTGSDTSAPIPLSGEYHAKTPASYADITATFNEPLKLGKKAGVGVATIRNEKGDSNELLVSVFENNVRLEINSFLLPNSQYAITVDADAITDLAGNAFTGVPISKPFIFITGNNDTTAPTLYPTGYEYSVIPVGKEITLSFDELIKTGAGTITLNNGQGDIRKIAINDASQVSFAGEPFSGGYGASFSVHPTPNLLPDSKYLMQSEPSIITDLSGNPFAGLTGGQTIILSTQKLDPNPLEPIFVNINGQSDWQQVGLKVDIMANFNRPIKAGTGNIIISNGQGDTRTIAVGDNTQIHFSDTVLEVTPSKKLLPDTRYHVLVDKGVITDLTGIPYAGIQDPNAFTFVTKPLFSAANNPVVETNNGNSVGRYENTDILTFYFSSPIKEYSYFELSAHSFGGNDLVLSQDGLSVSVALTAESTVVPGDVLTLRGVTKRGAEMYPPVNDVEFAL
ncbi:MAG: Ig-like domain-containing protein [Methylococcales bacterium]